MAEMRRSGPSAVLLSRSPEDRTVRMRRRRRRRRVVKLIWLVRVVVAVVLGFEREGNGEGKKEEWRVLGERFKISVAMDESLKPIEMELNRVDFGGSPIHRFYTISLLQTQINISNFNPR